MAATGYSAQAFLAWLAAQQAMPAQGAIWAALFTTAPNDSDSGEIEVSISGTGYARVQIGGSLAAGASWTTSSTTITMGSTVPAWVVAGMRVYDATAAAAIGTVSSTSGTTLTLTAAALHASSGSTDNLSFSTFGAPTSEGPSTATSGATATFPQATASWGTVVAWGIYDAATAGNLRFWDWLGNDPWFPFEGTNASPGVLTAYGITAGSAPALANGASVVVTARFGGTLPTGLSSETVYTVAGLSADTFNVGVNTTTTGAGMVRQVTQQPIAQNVTFSIPASNFIVSFG